MKYYKLHSTWDVAYKQGHFAFKLLAIAKEASEKVNELETEIPKVKHGSLDYLRLTENRDYAEEQFYQFISASIILFQSMMEAIINDSLEKEKLLTSVKVKVNDKFKEKWIESLKKLKQDTNEFIKYLNNIYRTLRYFIVHPKKRNLDDLNDVEYKDVYEGFKNGWKAYELLSKGLKHPHDKNSWKTMSNIY
jgi:hypothetical protein